MNEVGRCTPLTTVYGAVHNNFCEQTVNGVVSGMLYTFDVTTFCTYKAGEICHTISVFLTCMHVKVNSKRAKVLNNFFSTEWFLVQHWVVCPVPDSNNYLHCHGYHVLPQIKDRYSQYGGEW